MNASPTVATTPANVVPFVASLLRAAIDEGGTLTCMWGRWTSFDVRARFVAVASGFMTTNGPETVHTITDAGRAWVAEQPAVRHVYASAVWAS